MCNIFLNFFTKFPNWGIHPLQFGSIFNSFKPSACWLQTNFSNCLDMFINRLIHGSKLIFQQRWTANRWIVVSLIRQLSQVIICINYYILLWLKLLVDKNVFSVFTQVCVAFTLEWISHLRSDRLNLHILVYNCWINPPKVINPGWTNRALIHLLFPFDNIAWFFGL